MRTPYTLLLGLVLSACGSARTGATIVGAVQNSGAAAAGLQVSAQGRSATTNAAGQFALSGVGSGAALHVTGEGVDDQLELGFLTSGMRLSLMLSVKSGHVEVDDEEAEFSGSISAITATTLTVAGVTVNVDAHTQITQDDKTLALTDLKAGENVDVTGIVQPDKSVTAAEIEVEPAEAEAEVEGVVHSIDTTHSSLQVTVVGDDEESSTSKVVTIATDSNTKFRSGDETNITFADIKVGDRVHVRGTTQADGSVLASIIAVAPGFHAHAEVTGTITAIASPNLTVSGLTIVTDASTRIFLGEDTPGTLADLKVGDNVEVVGTPQSGGAILASFIHVIAPEPETEGVELLGAITAIASDGSSLTLQPMREAMLDMQSPVTVNVNSSTTFSGAGTPKSLADFKVGDLVHVEAQKQSDGSLLAVSVERLPAPPN